MTDVRIVYASVEDPSDVRAWSGTPFHMVAGLRAAGVEVFSAGPLRERLSLPLKAAQAARNAFGRTYYSRLREPVVLGGYAAQVRRAVQRHRPALVLAPSTLPVARLRADVPVVTWTDATFAGMLDFYPSYTGLSPRYRRLGHAMERAALARVALAVYTSEWAARSAVEDYGVPEERVAVVPYGANIPDPGPAESARGEECRLLLVGRGWERKGVNLAIRTAATLRSAGVPAVLDVVGSSPPRDLALPEFVTVHESLEKDDARAADELENLYRAASFFLLPTRADCTPVVLAEAQAHGLPVVTSDVGGTASMVDQGVGGWALPLAEFVPAAARLIEDSWRLATRYEALRRGARRRYVEGLTWSRASTALLRLLDARGIAR